MTDEYKLFRPITLADAAAAYTGKSTDDEPVHATDIIHSIPLTFQNTTDKSLLTLWLHAHQKRTCWIVKALHEYEAWVTTGAAPNSPRYTVERVAMRIVRDVDMAEYDHVCERTEYCAKSDEIYYYGNACGRSRMRATATIWGSTWGTGWTEIT